MKEKISFLIKLQDCDDRINEIISRKKECPLRIQKLNDELNDIEEKFQEEYNKLESLQKERRKIERDIQDLENNVIKSNIKLSNIKSNKEYSAALSEIEDFKKAKFVTEDKAIQIMEEIEELGKRCLDNKERREGLTIRFEKNKVEIEKKLIDLDKELAQLEKNRASYCQAGDQDLLKKYLFLREHKGGRGISPVIGGVCQTCHLGIPPQKFNDLIKGNSLLTCPNCNLIIYWGDDEHFQNLTSSLNN